MKLQTMAFRHATLIFQRAALCAISCGGRGAKVNRYSEPHSLAAGDDQTRQEDPTERPGQTGCEGEGFTMALVKACKTDQLEPGAALRINTSPAIAIFRLEDGFYATEDTCSHAQSSLAAGDVDLEDCTVECPYHASQFEIKTGRVLSLPATRPIRIFPVTIVGDEVFVEI